MEIDDIPAVYHLGERLFTAEEVPNLYRTWDEYEVIGLFQEDSEFCLVADADGEVVGFALGTTFDKPRSAWKYGLAWEPQSFRSHSDAGKLWESGTRPILLGPGELEKAHSPDESVSLPDVLAAAELYLDLARALTPEGSGAAAVETDPPATVE